MKTKLHTIWLTALMMLFCQSSLAETFEANGIYYIITSSMDKTVKVTSNPSKYSGEVSIPNTVTYSGNDYSVTSIGMMAFYNCTGLTHIAIPNSITSIGSSAFSGCKGLTSISLPNSIISIETSAFYNCQGLTSISIPNSVTIIGDNGFKSCSGLTSVSIPNSVTTIGNQAFYDCTGLTSVSIPNSVTSIGVTAFCNCWSLTSIFIPSSITEIGDNAFYGCKNLKRVYNSSTLSFQKGAKTNGQISYSAEYLFNNCQTDGDFLYINKNDKKYLCGYIGTETNLAFPGLDGIAAGAFYFCTNIIRVAIPNSMTDIGTESFKSFSSLQHISIPNSISSIGNCAFQGCTSLIEISLPNSVTDIGSQAFQGCTSLSNITLSNSVTSIGKQAFEGCTSLNGITLSNSITTIGESAFSGCCSLANITLSNSMTSISKYLLKECPSLTNVSIPNSVTNIGYGAFQGCTGLTSISIPNSMTSIGNYAFSGCTGLTSVSMSNNITSIGESAFPIIFGLFNEYENGYYLGNEENPYCALYYVKKPESNYYFIHKDCKYINASQSYGLYSSLGSGMKIFNFSSVILNANNQFPLRNLYIYDNCCKMDGDYVFSQKNEKKYVCGYLGTETELVLPDADGIYYAAFINSDLNNVSISDNTTDICEKAFYGCSKMAHIIVPQNITSIGAYAFSGCTSLKKVYNCSSLRLYLGSTSNGSVALYANYVYNYCQKNGDYILTSIDDKKYVCGYLGKETHLVFPQADGIYPNAFRDSQNIYKVTLSSNMTYIGNSAFDNCKWLSNISFSNKLTHIGDSAFQNCASLTNVSFPNSLTSINAHAFAGCSKLVNVILPNGLSTIGNNAFDGCSGATTFSIPQSVTNIGSQAFGNCSGSLTLHCDTEDATDYTGSSFYNANFCELVIGHEVEKIGNYAFYGMNTLQKIHIGSKVNRIGNNAFGNCTGLKGIYINAITPPRCRNSLVFHDDTKWDCPLYVPGPSINDYKSADVWKDFITIKENPEYSGIECLTSEYNTSASMFNLQGQLVSTPTKGKVYIQNGKKFLMK